MKKKEFGNVEIVKYKAIVSKVKVLGRAKSFFRSELQRFLKLIDILLINHS